MNLISGRQDRTYMFHLRFDLPGHFQLVRCFFGTNGQIYRIEPVDTIIALWFFFLMCYFQQLVQPHLFAVFVADYNLGSIKLSFSSTLREQYQPDPFLMLIDLQIACTEKFFLIILTDGFLNVVDTDV